MTSLFPTLILATPTPSASGPGHTENPDATEGVTESVPAVLGQNLRLPPAPSVGALQLSDPQMLGIQRDVKMFFETLRQAQETSGSPAESLAEVEALNGGPLSAAQAAELETFRSELSLFLAAASAAPGAGDLEPMRLFLSHEQILAATPADLYLLRERLSTQVDWSAVSSRLASPDLAALRPLAEHGPLGAEDRVALESFRQDLFDLLATVEGLPTEAREGHQIRPVDALSRKIATLPTESLYLLREQVGAGGLAKARHGAKALHRIETLTPEGTDELEALRADLLHTLVPMAPDSGSAGQIASWISQLRIEQLALAEATLAEIPQWQTTLPPIHAAAGSATLAADLEALRLGDATVARDLESFRVEMVASFDGMELPAGLEPATAAEASQFLRGASSEHLAIYREALRHGPTAVSPVFNTHLALATKALDQVELPRIPQLDFSCGFEVLEVGFDPCEPVSDFLNSLLVDPLNRVIKLVEDGINLGVDVINEISDLIEELNDLFSNLGFAGLIDLVIDAAMDVVEGALGAIGDLVGTIDEILGQAVGVIREFVDSVKRPFIDLVNSAGDPLSQSQLLTQLDGFVFNRDPNDGPLGLVTCMEEILCVQEETVSFEVILPGETEPVVRQEQLCRKGFFIPLIGEVGSDRSVFACMVIKNEIAFLKDLMPEDSLPGGKVADIALSSFVHRIDQLCYVNDWMAGNRQLLEERIDSATRDARFQRLLGSCTLDGLELDCPDLPDGVSIAGMLGGVAAEVGLVRADVASVQGDVDGLQTSLDTGFDNTNQRFNALSAQVSTAQTELSEQMQDFEALDLQMAIEANLAATATSESLSSAVSMFVLPEEVGGMLEVAEDLVISIIQRAQAAGLPIGDAREELVIAQAAIDAGEFRRGYLHLAYAYDAVLRFSPLDG